MTELVGCPRCDESARRGHAIYCPNEDCKYFEQTYSQICDCGKIDWEEIQIGEYPDVEFEFNCNSCGASWSHEEYEGPITGFTCGAFDLLHAGHIMMLQECKEHCDVLVVGLQSDPSVDRPEKNKPIQSLEERLIQLNAVKYVDRVIVYKTEEDLVNLLKNLQPDVRILGVDWKNKDFTGKDLDIKVIFNSRNHNYSTSELRRRISKAEDDSRD